MNNTIFIADQDSRCGIKITDKLVMNNWKVIQTVVNKNPVTEEKENGETGIEQKLIRLDWNCFSTISPKNVILQSKQFSDFSTAVVVFTPPETTEPFISQSHMEIQKSIDYYFRSLATISKEIINKLEKKSSANLYLILNIKNRDEMFSAVYRAFISSVLKNSNDSLFINGVENNSEDPEQFADYFYSILLKERRTGGKWLKQHQMNSFFNSFSGKQ